MLVSTEAGKRPARPSGSSIPGPRPARHADAADLLGVLRLVGELRARTTAVGRGGRLRACARRATRRPSPRRGAASACCLRDTAHLEPNLSAAEDSPGIGGDRRALQSASECSTGRPARDHSLHEPGYSRTGPESGELGGEHDRAGGHARAAVRDHGLAAGAAPRAAVRSSPGSRKRPPGASSAEGSVHGSRDVAGHRVDRLGLAAVALRRARVEQAAAPWPPASSASAVSPVPRAAPRSRRARPAARPASSGPPASRQAPRPPSSTAAFSWPKWRSSHQSRAAPPSPASS